MNVGGPARQVSFLQNRFLADGHQSTLIFGVLDEDEGDMSGLLAKTPHTIVLNCLRRPISIKNDLLTTVKLFWYFCGNDIHVVHTHTAKAGMVGRLALKLARPARWCRGYSKTLCVHTFHGHVFSGYFSKALTRVYKGIERMLWRWTDVVVVLTPKLGAEILGHLNSAPEKMHVIPLGLNLEPYLAVERKKIFGTSDRQPKVWVGWVGRMVDIKNPFRFIELAQELEVKLGDDVGFVMVGDGSLMAEVEDLLIKTSLRSSFVLTGWRSDLLEVYSGLDVLVNTSDNEGTPVAILEAMAAGLPVLATDVGGTAEVLAHAPEGLSSALSPERFTEAGAVQIEAWLKSGARLSEATRERVVELYSEERLYQKLLSIYQSEREAR
jgi:glycosyltransferase involved in cell wall biosynthesis